MKSFFYLLLLVSTHAFSQEELGQPDGGRFSQSFHVIGSKFGPGLQAGLKYNSPKSDISGALAVSGMKDGIGYVDVEILKNSFEMGKSKKFRILLGYSPFELSYSTIAKTTEAFLKLKFGAGYDKTNLKFNVSGLGSFEDPQTKETRWAVFQGAELEQKIGNHLKIAAMAKYGFIAGDGDKNARGSYKRGKAELEYKFKNEVSIIGFYEIEDFNYQMPNKSVSNAPRYDLKQKSVATIGIGVRAHIVGGQ